MAMAESAPQKSLKMVLKEVGSYLARKLMNPPTAAVAVQTASARTFADSRHATSRANRRVQAVPGHHAGTTFEFGTILLLLGEKLRVTTPCIRLNLFVNSVEYLNDKSPAMNAKSLQKRSTVALGYWCFPIAYEINYF